MEKNIYDLLNDVKVDIESYGKEEMTEVEKKKLLKEHMMTIQKERQKKNYKKFAAVASFVLIGVSAIGGIQTFASINPTIHTIAQTLGIDKDLGSYTSVVGKSITKEGTTAQISEVIYDKKNNKLILSTVLSSVDGVKEGTTWSPHLRIYINGQEMNVASYSTTTQIDENTMGFVTEYFLDQEFEGDMDIKVVIAGAQVNDIYEKKRWSFEFTTNGGELVKDTYQVELNHSVALQDGQKLKLENYTSNALGQSIYYAMSNETSKHLLMIKGENNLGQPVVFNFKYGEISKGGEFKLDETLSNLSNDTTSMTLQVYSLALPEQEGPITGEYEPVGEAFTITLP